MAKADKKHEKMDQGEVRARVQSFVEQNSAGGSESNRSTHRIDALKRYRGEKFGNEVPGRSQVVTRDVMEVIESLMPSLMKIFTATDRIVEFVPANADSADVYKRVSDEAKQATALVNHVFFKENPGFLILYTWIKAALMWRVSTVKVWWDRHPDDDKEVFEGVAGPELASLLTDETLDVVGLEDAKGNPVDLAAMTPQTLERLIVEGGGGFSVVCKPKQGEGRVVIENVPPEEFIYDQDATDLNDRIDCAHHRQIPLSEAVALGVPYDVACELKTTDSRDSSSERWSRQSRTDKTTGATTGDDQADGRDMVWITDAYMFLDVDGDGIEEYRRIVIVGPEHDDAWEVENREVDDHAFSSMSPIIMPHEPEGESVDDQVQDLQKLKTVIVRQMLDNLYRVNSPRLGMLEGQVSVADVLSETPGQPIRMRRPDALFPVATPPTAQASFPMIEMVDTWRETRTGVTRYNQGIDADALNKTAAGIQIISQAGQERPELIARTFAEVGMKRLAEIVSRLSVRYQNRAKVIQVADKFVPVSPRAWRGKFTVTARVGLGTGNRDKYVANLGMMLAKQEQILQVGGLQNNPLVSLPNYYNGLMEMADAMDIKAAERFFTDPASFQPPPKEPTPEEIKAQAEAAKLKAEADAVPAKLAEEQRANQAKEAIERDKLVVQSADAETEADLEVAKMSRDDDRYDLERTDAGKVPRLGAKGAAADQLEALVAQTQQTVQAMAGLMRQQQSMLEMLGRFMTAETELEYDADGMPVKARRVYPGQSNNLN